eukprot:SAG31_NODE_5953_length_2243_cov_4.189832_1_plen_357_part_10
MSGVGASGRPAKKLSAKKLSAKKRSGLSACCGSNNAGVYGSPAPPHPARAERPSRPLPPKPGAPTLLFETTAGAGASLRTSNAADADSETPISELRRMAAAAGVPRAEVDAALDLDKPGKIRAALEAALLPQQDSDPTAEIFDTSGLPKPTNLSPRWLDRSKEDASEHERPDEREFTGMPVPCPQCAVPMVFRGAGNDFFNYHQYSCDCGATDGSCAGHGEGHRWCCLQCGLDVNPICSAVLSEAASTQQSEIPSNQQDEAATTREHHQPVQSEVGLTEPEARVETSAPAQLAMSETAPEHASRSTIQEDQHDGTHGSDAATEQIEAATTREHHQPVQSEVGLTEPEERVETSAPAQ